MAEEVGYPYDHIPTEAFLNAAGGYGQATLCGAIGTAAAFIGTVCDKDTAKELVAELSKWYKKAEFPIYQPDNLGLPTTVADSVLCGDSVGNFMKTTGYEYGSPERKTRCAGVSGDVAKKVVELLNARLG